MPAATSEFGLSERGRDYADFEWQGGYADFSVCQSNLEPVKQYISGQEEHHRKVGFQDELRALLPKHEIECDEKYVLRRVSDGSQQLPKAATLNVQ